MTKDKAIEVLRDQREALRALRGQIELRQRRAVELEALIAKLAGIAGEETPADAPSTTTDLG